MKRRMMSLGAVLLCLSFAFTLANCGGSGGDGGGSAPQSPPAFTNLAGTRWSTADTVSGTNSCNVGIGVTDSWILHILAQSGNTISAYDERAGSSEAVNGTMSGFVVSYLGSRYPIQGCVDMSASYSITLNNAGTGFTGTGTITCNDAPACSVPISINGTRM